jgi:hypothetical protein
MQSRLNFIRQQGFRDAQPIACGAMFGALMWQPRVILVLVALGILFETGWYFIALAALLFWNALLARWSVFDAIHNRWLAKNDSFRLPPAPAPRRTAQGIAGVLSLAIGIAMITGHPALAWFLQVVFLIALSLLAFGRFCLGSFMYYVFTGQFAYAWRTMPWSRGPGKP